MEVCPESIKPFSGRQDHRAENVACIRQAQGTHGVRFRIQPISKICGTVIAGSIRAIFHLASRYGFRADLLSPQPLEDCLHIINTSTPGPTAHILQSRPQSGVVGNAFEWLQFLVGRAGQQLPEISDIVN
jgi:hypothetical protein